MFLRALAPLLTRRFSARSAQAQRSAAAAATAGTSPAPRSPVSPRSQIKIFFTRAQLLTLPSISAQRDLGVGRGAVKGVLALTSSLAGLLLGFLYFKQDRDDSGIYLCLVLERKRH